MSTREEMLKIVLYPFFKEEVDAQNEVGVNKYKEFWGSTIDMSKWALPYFSFAWEKNLIGFKKNDEGDDYFETRFFEEIARSEVADILFRTYLTHKNNWNDYSPLLRDYFFLENDLESIATHLPQCYFVDGPEEMAPIIDFLENKYGSNFEFYRRNSVNETGQVCVDSF